MEKPMPGLDHFGILAPFYEHFIAPVEPKELISFIGFPISGALLDAGGGTGRVAQFFSEKGNPVIIADLSIKMLFETRQKKGLRPVCGQTEQLPFPSGYFSRVIMVDALHHVYHQQQTVDEFWRVLQPGGRIIIEEPDLHQFAVKLIALGEKLALMRSHFLTPEQIAGLFHYPDAKVHIETSGLSSWVIAEKRQS
jgi:ubiquinone/menaquinone biosynthesis C-methylase UbiE